MMIRAYLRASTVEQDAQRATDALESFCSARGLTIAAWYIENASGRSTEREALNRLLRDAHEGDVLLVESVDRLTRLRSADWQTLRREIEAQGLRIVALDVPSTHKALEGDQGQDEMSSRVLGAVNTMLLEVLAAQAAEDYEQRRRRQREGIEKAKREGKFKGRPLNVKLHKRIHELRKAGFSIRKTAELAGTSTTTVNKSMKRGDPESQPKVKTQEFHKVSNSVAAG